MPLAAVAALERLAATADVPPEADVAAVDAFLVRAYERAWAGEL